MFTVVPLSTLKTKLNTTPAAHKHPCFWKPICTSSWTGGTDSYNPLFLFLSLTPGGLSSTFNISLFLFLSWAHILPLPPFFVVVFSNSDLRFTDLIMRELLDLTGMLKSELTTQLWLRMNCVRGVKEHSPLSASFHQHRPQITFLLTGCSSSSRGELSPSSECVCC